GQGGVALPDVPARRADEHGAQRGLEPSALGRRSQRSDERRARPRPGDGVGCEPVLRLEAPERAPGRRADETVVRTVLVPQAAERLLETERSPEVEGDRRGRRGELAAQGDDEGIPAGPARVALDRVLELADLDAEVVVLVEAGVRRVGPPAPAVLVDEDRVGVAGEADIGGQECRDVAGRAVHELAGVRGEVLLEPPELSACAERAELGEPRDAVGERPAELARGVGHELPEAAGVAVVVPGVGVEPGLVRGDAQEVEGVDLQPRAHRLERGRERVVDARHDHLGSSSSWGPNFASTAALNAASARSAATLSMRALSSSGGWKSISACATASKALPTNSAVFRAWFTTSMALIDHLRHPRDPTRPARGRGTRAPRRASSPAPRTRAAAPYRRPRRRPSPRSRTRGRPPR